MTSAQIQDAFRPFFTTREKGSGLGLPLARRHLELQGGSLDLQSTIGLGTIAVITLPEGQVVPSAASQPPRPPVPNTPSAGDDALLVQTIEPSRVGGPVADTRRDWPDGDSMIG
jgi:hypothetical protein